MKNSIEQAAAEFLDLGVGEAGQGCVIIRSGGMGAFVATRENGGKWVDAFWTSVKEDAHKIVDVTGVLLRREAFVMHELNKASSTGAGNSFLGGLAAGLFFTQGDVYKGTSLISVI